VRLTPRGGRDRIDGWADDPERPGQKLLRARVAAPPVDGAANAALVRLIAGALGVPKSAVALVAGQTARIKTVEVTGADPADLDRLG
jgi:uncharacterized protein YggU (UPF0235/DUF167 family)